MKFGRRVRVVQKTALKNGGFRDLLDSRRSGGFKWLLVSFEIELLKRFAQFYRRVTEKQSQWLKDAFTYIRWYR